MNAMLGTASARAMRARCIELLGADTSGRAAEPLRRFAKPMLRPARCLGAGPMRAVAALALALAPVGAKADYAAVPAVQEYIAELHAEHGFDIAWLADVFAGAQRSDDVIARMSRPAERALKWHEYRRIFMTAKRIDGGVDFWRKHQAAMGAARAEFGVAEEIVAAVIGVETLYGKVLGSHRVLDSLTTLAFDYPRRATFFKGQLTEFLLLVREEDADPFAFKGSYAGAMGYGQFIPSSYRAFAVDFDDDGQRDIWRNETDAIGSVANYFAAHDWRGTGPVALPVEVADGDLRAAANAGLDLNLAVGDLRAQGVAGLDALDDAERAALFRMETEHGEEFWLGLHDFYVITRYNRSAMYALAVLQLSQAIRQRFNGELAQESAGRGATANRS